MLPISSSSSLNSESDKVSKRKGNKIAEQVIEKVYMETRLKDFQKEINDLRGEINSNFEKDNLKELQIDKLETRIRECEFILFKTDENEHSLMFQSFLDQIEKFASQNELREQTYKEQLHLIQEQLVQNKLNYDYLLQAKDTINVQNETLLQEHQKTNKNIQIWQDGYYAKAAANQKQMLSELANAQESMLIAQLSVQKTNEASHQLQNKCSGIQNMINNFEKTIEEIKAMQEKQMLDMDKIPFIGKKIDRQENSFQQLKKSLSFLQYKNEVVENYIEKYLPLQIHQSIAGCLYRCLSDRPLSLFSQYDKYRKDLLSQAILTDTGTTDFVKIQQQMQKDVEKMAKSGDSSQGIKTKQRTPITEDNKKEADQTVIHNQNSEQPKELSSQKERQTKALKADEVNILKIVSKVDLNEINDLSKRRQNTVTPDPYQQLNDIRVESARSSKLKKEESNYFVEEHFYVKIEQQLQQMRDQLIEQIQFNNQCQLSKNKENEIYLQQLHTIVMLNQQRFEDLIKIVDPNIKITIGEEISRIIDDLEQLKRQVHLQTDGIKQDNFQTISKYQRDATVQSAYGSKRLTTHEYQSPTPYEILKSKRLRNGLHKRSNNSMPGITSLYPTSNDFKVTGNYLGGSRSSIGAKTVSTNTFLRNGSVTPTSQIQII